jgi:hypothetical protein
VNVTNSAFPGSYILEVNTVDGGTATKPAAFTVINSGIPTISALRPDAGYRNTTIAFNITGANFQPANTRVMFRNQTTSTDLNAMTLTRITSTAIDGTIQIPADAPTGMYRLDIITADGGVVNRINAFRVNAVSPPVISTLTPTSGAKNSIVAFTITGSNFQDGDKTSLALQDDVSGSLLTTRIYSVTPTKIIGSVDVPGSVPSGKYRLEVTTADGGKVNRYEAFTVNYLALPVITSISPTSGTHGTAVNFTLKGNNFVDGGTIVRIRAPGSTINSTLTSTNFTTAAGYFPIPAGAPPGPYRLDVITLGGGFNSKINGFSVM